MNTIQFIYILYVCIDTIRHTIAYRDLKRSWFYLNAIDLNGICQTITAFFSLLFSYWIFSISHKIRHESIWSRNLDTHALTHTHTNTIQFNTKQHIYTQTDTVTPNWYVRDSAGTMIFIRRARTLNWKTPTVLFVCIYFLWSAIVYSFLISV